MLVAWINSYMSCLVSGLVLVTVIPSKYGRASVRILCRLVCMLALKIASHRMQLTLLTDGLSPNPLMSDAMGNFPT